MRPPATISPRSNTTFSPASSLIANYVRRLQKKNRMLFLTGIALLLSALSFAQVPTLVKDISAGTSSSTPATLTNFNGMLFFAATTSANGTELWKSDGTAAGTVMVKDINAGTASSTPTNFVVYNNMLYFVATTSANGKELWKTDGTEVGTVIVKDILSGTGSSSPVLGVIFNNLLYFSASNGTTTGKNGIELWRTDGTTAGTEMVADIYAGTSSSSPANYRIFNNVLYFAATDATAGRELWKYTGSGSPSRVANLNSGTAHSNPASLIVMNGNLYFVATTSTYGTELYKYNGAGTPAIVKDIYAGASNSSPSAIVVYNNVLIFSAITSANGRELWKSDGTSAGTVLVKDIYSGTTSASPTNFVNYNNLLYFRAVTSTSGSELWRTDGTSGGTILVKDIYSGATGSTPQSLLVHNNVLYFSAATSSNGREIWKSDGTSAGTVMILDIYSGASSSSPANFRVTNNGLFFTATNAANGTELWLLSHPLVYSVTGGGGYCSGGSGVDIGLNGSQTGVSYQLKHNGSNEGSSANGTGSAISFGNKTTAGTYTVTATNSVGSSEMNGSATVTINPVPTVSASAASYIGTSSSVSAFYGGTYSMSLTNLPQNPTSDAILTVHYSGNHKQYSQITYYQYQCGTQTCNPVFYQCPCGLFSWCTCVSYSTCPKYCTGQYTTNYFGFSRFSDANDQHLTGWSNYGACNSGSKSVVVPLSQLTQLIANGNFQLKHVLDYGAGSCGISTYFTLQYSYQGETCVSSQPITLIGSPSGGTFSGPGISGELFNPAIAGLGIQTITYSYTDAGGCSNNATATVKVVSGITYYADVDGDGFGDPLNTVSGCSQPAGYVSNNLDCDDNQLLYKDYDGDGYGSGSPIPCGVPNNSDCNDSNNNITLAIVYYEDADGDGFGNPNVFITQCVPPVGYVTNSLDCDDTQLLFADDDNDGFGYGPPAPCGVANNTDCDDNIDTLHASSIYYRDFDGDGYGNPVDSVFSCLQPTGYVIDNTDCDDANNVVHTGFHFYADTDGDGLGTGNLVFVCASNANTPPVGFSLNNSDCNDNNPSIHGPITYYEDADEDGFGNPNVSILACTPPLGYVTNNLDCDDTELLYADNDNDGFGAGNPVACGVANDADCNDNNPNIHDGNLYYADEDGDGYGDPNAPTRACSLPPGYVTNSTDCDDEDNLVHTGYYFYLDEDGDGVGAGSLEYVCAANASIPPAGYSLTGTDCDDANPLVSAPPAAPIASAQTFCSANNKTVNDLVAIGQNLEWYDAATAGNQYTGTELLNTGTYYVSQTANGCESGRTAVSVTVTLAPVCQNGGTLNTTTCGCNCPPGYGGANCETALTPATALHFDGINDYVDLGDLNAAENTSTFSAECWVKFNAFSGSPLWTDARPLISKWITVGAPGGQNSYILLERDGKLEFWVANDAGQYYTLLWPHNLTTSIWYHLAITFNNGILKIYRNGVEVATASTPIVTQIANSSTALFLGNWYYTLNPASKTFSGSIDEVRFWNQALTQNQIQNRMNCELPSAQGGLVAYYKLNSGFVGGNNAGLITATDASSNNNHGTLQNFALTGTTSNWTSGNVSGTCASCIPPIVSAGSYNDACISSSSVSLSGTPSGGTFSGNGVTGNNFDPFTAGAGTHTIAYSYTDGNGCSNSATASITVHPLPPVPTITANGPTSFCPSGSVSLNSSSATGNQWKKDGSIISGATNQSYVTTTSGAYSVEVTVNGCTRSSDPLNDISVVVQDIESPSITAPANISVNADNAACEATNVPIGSPTTSDNCGVQNVVNDHPATTYPVGITNVTWTVTDVNGNTNTATQTVTIVDNQPPSITAPANISVNADNAACEATNVSIGNPTTSDNCGVQGVTNDHPSTTYPVGLTTVTWTVMDVNGNTKTATQTVTVTDNQIPSIIAPANVSVSADNAACEATNVSIGNPTTLDNCGVQGVTNNHPSTSYPVGVTTVTWTVTDVNGNTNTATQAVTVTDNQHPSITAPANVTVSTDQGQCFATNVSIGNPIISDNCTFGQNPVSNNAPASFPKGSTTVTWTVTDASGNTATANQIVTVNDTQLPTITAPAALSVATDPGQCSAGGGYGTVSGGPVSWTKFYPATLLNYLSNGGLASAIPNPNGWNNGAYGAQINAGTDFTLTYAIRPQVGYNQIMAGYSHTVPSAGTYPLKLLYLDGMNTYWGSLFQNNGPAVVAYQLMTIVFTRVSGNISMSINGVNKGVVEAWNGDVIPHVIIWSDGTLVKLESAINSLNIGGGGLNLGTPVYSDNCSGASTSNNAPASFPKGQTTVTWTVTDASGNTATANQIVTVSDIEVPTISAPQPVTVNTDLSQCYASNVSLGNPTISDNCAFGQSPVSNDAPATFNKGTTTVIWTVTDASGNTATANQIVTVNDNEIPTISAPANVTISMDAGQCVATNVQLGNPNISDNCPFGQNPVSNNAPATFPKGQTTVTWTVTDASGNTATANQTVTVNDTEVPTIACVSNQTRTMNPGLCTYETNGGEFDPVSFGDNCPSSSIVNDYNNGSTLANAVFQKGNTTVTWTVSDGSGNISTCSFVVTITDNEVPTIAAPQPVTVNTDLSQCYASNVSLGNPNINDNCAFGQNPVSNNAPATFNKGATTVVWTVTDASGNTATANQIVTVNDNELPTITAPANVTVSTNQGQCVATNVSLGNPTVSDNCPFGQNPVSNNAPATYPKGETTVTWTVTDASGNTATASQTVTVNDTEVPTIACISNQTRNMNLGLCTYETNGGEFDPISFGDNCPSSSIVNDYNNGSTLANAVFPKGNTTVTWTVTDGSNNTSSCSFVVTITDNEVPTIAAPQPVTVNTDLSQCYASNVSLGNPTINDNCTFGQNPISNNAPATFNKGTTTVLWTVTDASGNTATANQIVTVNDIETPAISCIGSQTRNTDPGLCTYKVSGTEFNPVSFGDNCPGSTVKNDYNSGSTLANAVFPKGQTTVEWTVTDAAGNTSTCSFVVTVEDHELPEITCPGNIADVNNDPGTCGAVVTYSTPVGTDNCPGAQTVQTAGMPSGSIFPVGTTMNSFTVTDAEGYAATCSFTITVKPVATTNAVTVTANTRQYSDVVTISSRITDGAVCQSKAAQNVMFKIGTQTMHSAAVSYDVDPLNSKDLIAVLPNCALIEPTPWGAAPTGNMSPGNKQVSATISGSDPEYSVQNGMGSVKITSEDVGVEFTGSLYVNTASSSSGNFTATLAATIQDISVMTGSSDLDPGDIRHAKVKFVNRDNGQDISGWLNVGLVNNNDCKTGTVVYNWSGSISGDAADFTVGVVVGCDEVNYPNCNSGGSYYCRNHGDDDIVLHVVKPSSGDYITGGGYLISQNSNGMYAANNGSKNNFGFNVKYNKSGKSLQGNINTIFRHTDQNGDLHVYQVKGNAMTQLSAGTYSCPGNNSSCSTVNGKRFAVFNGKANIQDITDPNNVISLGGNLTLQVSMTDMGDPGSSDSLAINVWDNNGGLIYSSYWNGSNTVKDRIDGGNLKVSGSNVNPTAAREVAAATLLAESINIYPNPNTGVFFIVLPHEDENTYVRVLDVDGKVVLSENSEAGMSQIRVNMQHVSRGIYFVEVQNGDRKSRTKIVVD